MLVDVLRAIIQLSEPLKHQGLWEFLPTSGSLRVITRLEDEFRVEMEGRFTQQELEASGVYTRANDVLKLSPVLTRGKPFLVLRRQDKAIQNRL